MGRLVKVSVAPLPERVVVTAGLSGLPLRSSSTVTVGAVVMLAGSTHCFFTVTLVVPVAVLVMERPSMLVLNPSSVDSVTE